MSLDKASMLFDQLTKTARKGHDAEWLSLVGKALLSLGSLTSTRFGTTTLLTMAKLVLISRSG